MSMCRAQVTCLIRLSSLGRWVMVTSLGCPCAHRQRRRFWLPASDITSSGEPAPKTLNFTVQQRF